MRYRAELAADRGSHALVVQLPPHLASHLASHLDLGAHLGPLAPPPAELAAELAALSAAATSAAPPEPVATGLAAPPPAALSPSISEADEMLLPPTAPPPPPPPADREESEAPQASGQAASGGAAARGSDALSLGAVAEAGGVRQVLVGAVLRSTLEAEAARIAASWEPKVGRLRAECELLREMLRETEAAAAQRGVEAAALRAEAASDDDAERLRASRAQHRRGTLQKSEQLALQLLQAQRAMLRLEDEDEDEDGGGAHDGGDLDALDLLTV